MDLFDRAQVVEERDRAAAIERGRGELATLLGEAQADAGARLCVDCSAVIDPRRIAAFPCATRCVRCQADRERSMR